MGLLYHSRSVMGLLYLHLYFLETSGPRQAFIRTALPFSLTTWFPLGHASPVTGLFYIYLNFLEPSGPRQSCNGTTTLLT